MMYYECRQVFLLPTSRVQYFRDKHTLLKRGTAITAIVTFGALQPFRVERQSLLP